jgi:ATP/maltotriose-dependent transcriptional regulator MalT
VVTEREREVLALAAQGFTARQIGNRLGVTERTVTTHLDHIYRKLGVSGRIAAISAGQQLGLLAAAG